MAGRQWGNELADIDPALNVVLDAAVFARTYFGLLDSDAPAGREEAARCATEAADAVAFKPSVCDEMNDPYDEVRGIHESGDSVPNICTSP